MNETESSLPQASVEPRRRSRLSMVWIVPIFAAIVAIGIAVQRIVAEGPTITIVFKSAQGIEPGKTLIKYKDVTIGQVGSVELTDDFTRVTVTAKMARSAEGLLVDGAKFWVVSPRIGLSGISGLNTLLSGNYIGFEAATEPGARQRSFKALDVPPVVSSSQPGRPFTLVAPDLGSLGVGSPLYFRRLPAGQVTATALAADGRSVELKVFVNEPFDRFVTESTRFWNASGIDMTLNANGLALRTESLVSLLVGGIAFESRPSAPEQPPAPADARFRLFADMATAMKQPDPRATHYVLFFEESLRGLSVGAPVTLLGLQGGEVTDVGLQIDPLTLRVRGRVEIVAYPQRIADELAEANRRLGRQVLKDVDERHALVRRLVEQRGLRAQLRTGNLLTGQLYVALDFFPQARRANVDWSKEPVQLPVVPGALGDLEQRLTSIVAKIDALPFQAIGDDTRAALQQITALGAQAQALVQRLDAQAAPELKPALEAIRRAAESADRALRSSDANLLGADAPAQQDLRRALQEVTRAARSLRVLADYLETHPEALIRGKTEDKP